MAFGSVVVTLEPGDTLVLYTDGVIEARRRGVMFGIEGVRSAIAASTGDATDLAQGIERAVLDHTGEVVSDDLAALIIHATDQDGEPATE